MLAIIYLALLYLIVYEVGIGSTPPAVHGISFAGFAIYVLIVRWKRSLRLKNVDEELAELLPELNSLREQRGAEPLDNSSGSTYASLSDGLSTVGDLFSTTDGVIGAAVGAVIDWGVDLVSNIGKSKIERNIEARCKELLEEVNSANTAFWTGIVFVFAASLAFLIYVF